MLKTILLILAHKLDVSFGTNYQIVVCIDHTLEFRKTDRMGTIVANLQMPMAALDYVPNPSIRADLRIQLHNPINKDHAKKVVNNVEMKLRRQGVLIG